MWQLQGMLNRPSVCMRCTVYGAYAIYSVGCFFLMQISCFTGPMFLAALAGEGWLCWAGFLYGCLAFSGFFIFDICRKLDPFLPKVHFTLPTCIYIIYTCMRLMCTRAEFSVCNMWLWWQHKISSVCVTCTTYTNMYMCVLMTMCTM